ncbi:DUF1553 domain-containing protein [Tundrisphaera sp. TA3]|uniref:DUF1553 domain-containing protein n=1 Tax=Tundrisphaera sp. TA3 TaxID=3435775 RepID=UPI003EBF1E98
MSRPDSSKLMLAAVLCWHSAGWAFGAEPQAPTAEQVRFFESQVRPVLVEQCGKCHGASKPKAGFRVDSRSAMISGGDTGPGVVPGKPDESLLMAALRYEGPEMPPKGKLPARQIEAIAQWITMGAPWPGGDAAPAEVAAEPEHGSIRRPGYAVTDADRSHWAFRPLVRPEVPKVADAAWAARPIDAFIARGLEAKKLAPNPPASRSELARRITYDLTGLPPTPEEVAAFEADSAPDAYEKLVDRLLASPHYGERWGRHWLDLVRFAETNSYERDGAKPNAWRFRDYVIRSFNEDKPYDRFVREQLAGDEMPDGGVDGLTATGFYRLGLWDDEPADREQAHFDSLDDIVATTSQVFLGLTVDCARCHDHKLDPIPQKDYYRFLSFFGNINDYRNGGPTDESLMFRDDEARKAHEAAIAEIKEKRDRAQAELTAIETEFQDRYRASGRGGVVQRADIVDLSYRFYRDTWDELPTFDELKPEQTGQLPGGRFDLAPRTRDEAFGFVFEGTLIVPADGRYTFTLDSDDGSRLLVDEKKVAERDGIHGEGDPKRGSITLTRGQVPIRLEYFQKGHGLGLTVAWSGPGFRNRALSAPMQDRSEENGKAKGTTFASPLELARMIREEGASLIGAEKAARYRELRRELDALKKAQPPGERILRVTEAGRQAPDVHVMLRGNPHTPGDKVDPGFLQVLSTDEPRIPELSSEINSSGRRLALAEWIVSDRDPLAARVMANRVWQYHFGRGIVRSPNNFGTQGDPPTHPELLDWLASELVAGGWRLKSLHRTILLSNAYRMSSRDRAEAAKADPTNDAFWRFDMRRLSGEEIRDSVLAITGTLNPRMYGPGVYPAIPAEVLAGQSKPGDGWGKSSPEEQARRSVYIHVKRSLLYPILESFDFAETDRSTPVRFATTQPTQALGMLNGSFLNRQAVLLADRLTREVGDDPGKQAARAIALVTCRPARPDEISRALDLMRTLRDRDHASAREALEAFCLVALNLNEFIYLD